MQRLTEERELADLSPRDLLKRAQEPPKPKPPSPRKCCKCGCEDRQEVIQGEFDERGNPLLEHWVTIELRYIKKREDLTPRLRVQGWKLKEHPHQGRTAMERLICEEWMERSALMEREWLGKRRSELKQNVNDFSYYQMVCEETIA